LMISSICSFASSTYALNPRALNISCLTRWSALIFLPGAFTSTKPHHPPGSSTNRSGIPSKPGLVNFTARPPIFLTAFTSCFSISCSSTDSSVWTRGTKWTWIPIRACMCVRALVQRALLLDNHQNPHIVLSCPSVPLPVLLLSALWIACGDDGRTSSVTVHSSLVFVPDVASLATVDREDGPWRLFPAVHLVHDRGDLI
jgi:hypothetical protein